MEGKLPISTPKGNTDGHSFIGLALSCNGRDFSRLVEIAPSTGREGRAFDQPVDGFLTRGGIVSVLIHRDVYEISPVAKQRSRLVRKELNKEALQQLSQQVKGSLLGCAP